MALNELDTLRSVEELSARRDEIEAEMTRMHVEADGAPFDEEQGSRFADLSEERGEAERRIKELVARQQMIAGFAQREGNVERISFNTPRPGATRNENIYDLGNVPAGDKGVDELRERALRAIDTAFPTETRDRVANLVETNDSAGNVARRILTTSSPVYKRAFGKMLVGREHALTNEERTSLSTSGSAGGYAVPSVVDPTVVLTSNGQINPVRQMARVITITGNTWTGISSAGVTASYDAELAEVSDDSPTFSQPSANVEKAQAFIQYSIEIDEDWGALQSEMAMLFADAKDSLESSKFLTGLGHSSNEPEGLLVGATGTVLTATASVMAVADLYSLVEALAPRWRARAQFAGSFAAYNKIRQFDSSGGASLWVQLGDGRPARLLGFGDFEWSQYSSAVGTPGSSVLTFGDFNEFTIVDRVGMNVEFIPHMFNTNANLPDGRRGLYAYWRNTSDVRTSAAFKTLKIR